MKSKGCLLTHWLPVGSMLFNIVRICHSHFKCKYLKNETLFLNFLFHFWNLHQILNILKKKMMAIANLLPKLETVENFVTALSKKRCFGTSLDSEHLRVSRIIAKSPWQHFSYDHHLFLKFFRIWYRLQKWNKKFRKSFLFFRYSHLNWELQHLILGYLPSAVNVLTNTP